MIVFTTGHVTFSASVCAETEIPAELACRFLRGWAADHTSVMVVANGRACKKSGGRECEAIVVALR